MALSVTLPTDHGDPDVWGPILNAAIADVVAYVNALEAEVALKAEIIESLTDPGGADGTWWAVPS